MAKLYFRYGTVGSAKTMNLLAVAHNYRQQGKQALIVKPYLDDRFGFELVKSRAGLEQRADIILKETELIDTQLLNNINCLLVDEAQFLSITAIDQLRSIASDLDIPVICYGLRADFKRELFAGSKRLLELCDSIEEVKTTCHFCARKAIFNLKHVNGVATLAGPSIDLGAEEKYLPTCSRCYTEQISKI